MLEMKNVNYSYKSMKSKERVNVLENLSLKFETGNIYAIYGPSGAGKTTCLSLLGGLEKPDSGSITIDGKDIREEGYQNIRKKKISYVFQDYQLFPYMTAIENVMVALDISNKNLEKETKKERSIQLLEKVGLTEKEMYRVVSKLSGGQQQRVAIARALVNGSEYILADEPTGNLDEKNAENILQLLKTIAHEDGKCVIVVTHSNLIKQECDEVIKLGEDS